MSMTLMALSDAGAGGETDGPLFGRPCMVISGMAAGYLKGAPVCEWVFKFQQWRPPRLYGVTPTTQVIKRRVVRRRVLTCT